MLRTYGTLYYNVNNIGIRLSIVIYLLETVIEIQPQ